MHRRTFLASLFGGAVLGTGTARARHTGHPVVPAMSFRWYDGTDPRVDAGPMVILDMVAAGGRWETTLNSGEYAYYISESHPAWREYNRISNISEEISKHLFSVDGMAGIVLWEEAFGANRRRPEDWEYDRSDFEDWFREGELVGNGGYR